MGYQPLFYSLLIIMIVGGFIPLVVSSFVDVEVYDNKSIISGFIDFLTYGFNIDIPFLPDFTVNLFTLFLPDVVSNFIISQLNAFSYLPNYISLPLLVFCLIGFVYGVVDLFLP